jgi:hypothetical protein
MAQSSRGGGASVARGAGVCVRAAGACGGLGVSWRDHFGAGFLDQEFDPEGEDSSPSGKMGMKRLWFDIVGGGAAVTHEEFP